MAHNITRGACCICGRSIRGYAYQAPDVPGAPMFHYCSMECLKIRMWGDHEMRDDEAAREKGGEAMGAYLDSIGIYDLASLSKEQWYKALAVFDEARAEHLKELAMEAPF